MNVCLSYKMLQYERIDVSEGTDINKSNKSKECRTWHIVILKTLVIKLNHMFVINVMIYQ